ncbi:MAG: tetratricopeptide repeat protein [Chloroflexi bacterium]|nr:tetratricopeptide repeat protein [Chloroflexota bacterium]
MDTPSNYIPIDLRHAFANDQPLPEKVEGAALFADISGFTPLTEALAQELGPRRGAEELTIHLNRVYGALIAELHQFGGSVISFSGDAITCWLDGDDGRRATAVALAMQTAMENFANVRTAAGNIVSLALKVAVATGSGRRFLVGDPDYCRIDTMAGVIMERLATAEHHAERGDIILDEATVDTLADALTIAEWRSEDESGQRFAVVTGMSLAVSPTPWPELPNDALSDEVKSAWLLPPVYQRLHSGSGEFLAELRPAYALFLRFTGIDYDNDPDAPHKLDTFVRAVQHILARLEGSMLQLTIGDKGSYFYAAFGAPIAHENDAIRIANTALELQTLATSLPFIDPVQIGITTGRVRVGAYGSVTRRTYGVLGDAVNLSARLMAAAKPGQILVSEAAKIAAGNRFVWEQLTDIRVKGKSEPIAIARLAGLKKGDAAGLQKPQYHLPMVGRLHELDIVRERITAVFQNHGHIIGVTGEAGMGKSRFVAEAIQIAQEQGLTVLGGECESYGTTTSYLVWRGVWRGFFGLDSALSLEAQVAMLEAQLQQLDSALLPRLPLLGAVLNLAIPENDLTRSLDAKVRKSSLEEMLTRCLYARANTQPLLLVLEDCHWLDDLSRDLIGAIGKMMADLPILITLVYRPLDQMQEQTLPVAKLKQFTEIALSEFSTVETRRLVELKLAHFGGADSEVPQVLLDRVTTQAAGNPFYIEELLNYLQDLGVDVRETAVLQTIDLPTSIYALVLSRIDKLAESQQLTIKVASVIGRLFRAGMLWGIYPDIPMETLQHNLEMLSRLELIPLETPEPELSYLFKHIITQQVAYGSLLYSTKAVLHEQIGDFIERTYADTLEQYINLLAFHYEHSENETKKRTYLLKAGEAAQKDYANSAAISYYEKSLPLLTDRALVDTQIKLGKVFELTGAWDEAGNQYDAALELANALADQEAVAWCQTALGELWRKRNEYETAAEWFASAQKTFESLHNTVGVGQVLHFAGTLAAHQGNYVIADQHYQESLTLRRELNDQENEASLLSNLGIVARYLGNRDAEREFYEESLAIREAIGDRWGVAVSLNNLGNMAIDSRDTVYARQQLDRALVIWQEIGERWATTNTMHNLANVSRDEGDFQQAKQLYTECLSGWRALDDTWGIAYWLEDMGLFYLNQSTPERAIKLLSAAASLRERIGAPRPPAHQTKLDQAMAQVSDTLDAAEQAAASAAGAAISLDDAFVLAVGDN